jgi:uncharacterized membrane protein YhaH (DUF805 family)
MNRTTYWVCLALILGVVIAANLMGAKRAAVPEALVFGIAMPRLHDIGRTGWWAGGAFILELVLAGAMLAGVAQHVITIDAVLPAFGVFTVIIAGLLIYLGSVPGDAKANRFGEPPRAGLSYSGYSGATTKQ